MDVDKNIIIQNNWSSLQQFTLARIALGRTGVSIPTKEMLRFKMAHAHARDAVFSLLNKEALINELNRLQLPFVSLQSNAVDRHLYLQRPDWGRRLNEASAAQLSLLANNECDVCISLADGLSAEAINRHAIPVIKRLIIKLHEYNFSLAPICLIEGARVAISDETGSLLKAKLSIIFVGERPGLSSPDSLSAYLTYAPQTGLTDERRNCVSNIRPEGLVYEGAVDTIIFLVKQAMQLRLSGIRLKDNGSNRLTGAG